ncbi:hypothetical protein [Thalassobius sp. MITS945101]|uniref:hypothetical protein n=1 Tax=Thalassobius sp. MITS945101 TaxID=3096994 RepID=UPI00399AD35D
MIRVNDQVINRYEIEQRAAFLEVLNVPGNLNTVAREQLVEDRLKMAGGAVVWLQAEQVDLQNGPDRICVAGKSETG